MLTRPVVYLTSSVLALLGIVGCGGGDDGGSDENPTTSDETSVAATNSTAGPSSTPSASGTSTSDVYITSLATIARLDRESGEVKQITKIDGVDFIVDAEINGDQLLVLGKKNVAAGGEFFLTTLNGGKQESLQLKTPSGSTTFQASESLSAFTAFAEDKVYAQFLGGTSSGLMELRSGEYLRGSGIVDAIGAEGILVTLSDSSGQNAWTIRKADGSTMEVTYQALVDQFKGVTGQDRVAFAKPKLWGDSLYFLANALPEPETRVWFSALIQWPLDGFPKSVNLGKFTAGSGVAALPQICVGADGVLVIHGGGGGTQLSAFDAEMNPKIDVSSSCELFNSSNCEPYKDGSSTPNFLQTVALTFTGNLEPKGLWVRRADRALVRLDSKDLHPLLVLPREFIDGIGTGQTNVGARP
ncbi:MAG: hypothetical protein AB7J35_21140 [Dehalococcoidia bacterium]